MTYQGSRIDEACVGPNPILRVITNLVKDYSKKFHTNPDQLPQISLRCRSNNRREALFAETGGNCGQYGAALCIGGTRAEMIRPQRCNFISAASRPNGDHAIFALFERAIVMMAGHVRSNSYVFVFQVNGFELKGLDLYANLQLVAVYDTGTMGEFFLDYIKPNIFPDEFLASPNFKAMLTAVYQKSMTPQNIRPIYCLKWNSHFDWSLEDIKNDTLTSLLKSASLSDPDDPSMVSTDWAALVEEINQLASNTRITAAPRNKQRPQIQLLMILARVPKQEGETEYSAIRITIFLIKAYSDYTSLVQTWYYRFNRDDTSVCHFSTGNVIPFDNVLQDLVYDDTQQVRVSDYIGE